jgi:hypothetical protein
VTAGCPTGTGRPTARSPARGHREPPRRQTDQDFRDGHLLGRSPRKLLAVATGNITNDALISRFELHLDAIVSALGEADFVELAQDALALGRRRDDAPS